LRRDYPSLRAKRSNQEAENSAFAAAYRDGLGLACVAVHRGSGGITIEASTSADAAAAVTRWWCRRESDAARIAAAARAALRRHESKAGARPAGNDSHALSAACAAVAAAARRHGVALFSDDDIAAHAAEIAVRIDAELQKLKESGDLKSVNQTYKSYRLQLSGRGERALRYNEWMRQYRADLVRQAAAALREL
jgi:hypothetical protein